MSKGSLEQWLQYLERLHPVAMELGLERVSGVAATMGLLSPAQPVVTVAGTNGKGSVVAVLEAILEESGRSTGVFTSPHILCFNERIRVRREAVSDDEIIAAFTAIEAARGATSLTYFEFSTLAALHIFRARQPDVLVLEVGLGGRLDAVNILDADLAVITAIDLDHQDWLGHTRGEIAREKAGILRRGRPVVVADPAAPPELLECVERVGAEPALFTGRDYTVRESGGCWEATLSCRDGGTLALPPRPVGSLLPQNIVGALQAALLLGVEPDARELDAVLDGCRPRGRREQLTAGGCNYVLDVAHNPASIYKLVEYLSVTPCKGDTIAIFSVMKDKDVDGMVAAAKGHFDRWFLADQPANPRALPANELAARLQAAGQDAISISADLWQALGRAQRSYCPGDRLVVFGSFFTVAGVLSALQQDPNIGEIN